MPTSPASALGLLPSSCPILRAGRSTLPKYKERTSLFFTLFSIRILILMGSGAGYHEHFGGLNFMEFGLDMGCALIPTFPPCLDGPAGGRLWITAAHTPQTRVQKNPKNAPECNLIFQKNCLDNWVHLRMHCGKKCTRPKKW